MLRTSASGQVRVAARKVGHDHRSTPARMAGDERFLEAVPVGYRPHVHVVRDDHAVITEVLPQEAGDDFRRERGGEAAGTFAIGAPDGRP